MALIPWGDDEDKKDDLFGAPAVKQIASVQDSAWQPAASGADAPAVEEDPKVNNGIFDQPKIPSAVDEINNNQNYLLSDEKAQVDQEKVQRDAQIAEIQRQEAARQAAIASAQRAAQKSSQFQEGEVQTTEGQPLNVEEVKQDDGWRQFYDEEFKREKDSLDFWGRLMDGGGASRRAEINARNKYNSQLMLQAYDDDGNVLDMNAAMQGRKLASYNSALAENNQTRTLATGRSIGATHDNKDTNLWDRLKSAINAQRNMSVYDGAFGVDDKYNSGANDVGRFIGNLGQGIVTAPTIGGKAIYESIDGEGTDYSTGFQKELDGGERVGRAIAGGVDAVGAFFGGSGNLIKSLSSKVVTKTATQAEKTMLKKLTQQLLVPALVDGGENAVQAGAEYFGNDGSLLDENGEIDPERVAQLITQTAQGGAMGVAGGAAFAGGAMGVNRLRSGDPNIPTVDLNTLESRAVGADGAANIPTLERVDSGAVPATQIPESTLNPTVFERPTNRSESLIDSEFTPALDIATPDSQPAPIDTVADNPALAARVPEIPDLETAAPIADGVVTPPGDVVPVTESSVPAQPSEQIKALEEAKAGKSQADEAVINKQIQDLEGVVPADSTNIPDDMEVPSDSSLSRKQVAERLMPKLADNSDVKTRIANAVEMDKDVASPVRSILEDGGVEPKKAERVAKQFDKLEEQLREYNKLEDLNQRAYTEGGTDALDSDVSRDRSRVSREMGITTRRLMAEIKRLEGSNSKKTKMINNITDLLGTRNANILSSAGLLERNITQELTANAKLAIKNPIKMAKSTFGNGNILKDTAKAELSNWKDAPRTPVEAGKYIIGNTYRTGMIPTTALANTRRGAVREELTKWAFKELEGRELSGAETKKLSRAAGNEMEALVNTFIGVDNGMTNRKQATDALEAWKEYIRTGDDGAKAEYMKNVESHNSLADQMIAGLSKQEAQKARGLMAVKNLVFPFVRTATNLAKNVVRQDLNPFAKSLLDEIRADQRGGTANAVNTIKSKLVDYGIMGGAAALASSGVIVYNDGEEIDKPRGWSIKIGENEYIPVRATSLELPIAMAGAGQQMFDDITSGEARDWKYYAAMVTGSLPYIDQINTTTGAVDSLMSGEDGGYAAKSYGVNTIKSFVPGSNNGVQPYIAGKQGDSLNAKSVYDKDLKTWIYNTVRKSYDPNFYNSLPDSRDNAGRVRTVDNQGLVSNKDINDGNTAEFNDRITDLVDYGRQNDLGGGVQDMFNTYDTGENNNFKSVQDAITFFDVEDGGKPDNAQKLEKKEELTNLAQQIREGFYGDTASELLTLGDQTLKSDVSVPNKNGTKNTKLPLSIQSITNAIAQTDLPADQRDAMYEVSQKNTALYGQLKDKSISYDEYSAQKAKNEEVYTSILSQSKNYQKMLGLMDELDSTGFFESDGLGSTKSGQTYLWNALNALLGSKGATPASNYPESDSSGFTPWGSGGGGGTGRRATNKAGDRGNQGLKWTPVQARQMAKVQQAQYTPFKAKVKLGNAVKKDKSQNYSARSF